jgi:hypothetical protein
VLRYWSGQGHEKEGLLGGLMEFLIPRKYFIAMDPGWNPWDLEIYRGIWTKARVAVAAENYGGPNRVLATRVDVRPTASRSSRSAASPWPRSSASCSACPRSPASASRSASSTWASSSPRACRLARIINDALDIVANAIALKPVGGASPTAEPTPQAA